jgi:hypothetical protein
MLANHPLEMNKESEMTYIRGAIISINKNVFFGEKFLDININYRDKKTTVLSISDDGYLLVLHFSKRSNDVSKILLSDSVRNDGSLRMSFCEEMRKVHIVRDRCDFDYLIDRATHRTELSIDLDNNVFNFDDNTWVLSKNNGFVYLSVTNPRILTYKYVLAISEQGGVVGLCPNLPKALGLKLDEEKRILVFASK